MPEVKQSVVSWKQSVVFLGQQENVIFSKKIIFESDGKCIMKYIHTFALPQACLEYHLVLWSQKHRMNIYNLLYIGHEFWLVKNLSKVYALEP